MSDAFKNTVLEDIGCIVYVFDKRYSDSVMFDVGNCVVGDAAVAIKRISHKFGIDLEAI